MTIDSAFGNTIGGTSAGAANLISGNVTAGVAIGDGSSNNVVEGNEIGTTKDGATTLPNGEGVALGIAVGSFITEPSALNNTIGGTAAGAGNLISGNTGYGIDMSDIGATDNLVVGNRIGTNAAGTAALANGGGVLIGAPDNTIGGTTAGALNLISGNHMGVRIDGASATGNLIIGNQVGTDFTGTAVLIQDEGEYGIYVNAASGNTIGGTGPGAGNLISGNGEGVYVFGERQRVT